MTFMQFGCLSNIYSIYLMLILTLTYREFRRIRFNFNIFFLYFIY
ncbi:MAG: WzyE family oligosaccharide polymerase [Arsenophonus sp. ET-LJ4-MAG3]